MFRMRIAGKNLLGLLALLRTGPILKDQDRFLARCGRCRAFPIL